VLEKNGLENGKWIVSHIKTACYIKPNLPLLKNKGGNFVNCCKQKRDVTGD
jgi:hypothetical protein